MTREEIADAFEALKGAYEEIAWFEYNTGIEKGGMWMNSALSDAENLEYDMGLSPGWHEAASVKALIPFVVRKRLGMRLGPLALARAADPEDYPL